MAKKQIAFGNRLSDTSKSAEQHLREKYDIRPLRLDNLYPSDENKYSKDDIEELAVSISIIGLQHFITVKPADEEGRHKITDGERRYRAHKYLVDEMGEEDFNLVMCRVSAEEDSTITDYRMHSGNGTNREFTDADRVLYASEIRRLYEQLRAEGKIQGGRIRDYVAKKLKVSPTQIAIYSKIDKSLDPDLREAFDEGNIQITDAYAAASMPPEAQQILAQEYKDKGAIPSIPKKQQARTTSNLHKVVAVAILEIEKILDSIGEDESDLHDRCNHVLLLLKKSIGKCISN